MTKIIGLIDTDNKLCNLPKLLSNDFTLVNIKEDTICNFIIVCDNNLDEKYNQFNVPTIYVEDQIKNNFNIFDYQIKLNEIDLVPNILINHCKDHIVTIETYILDGETSEEKIDKRLKYFLNFTCLSMLAQKNKNFLWFLFVDDSNEYIKSKISLLFENSNIIIHYYTNNKTVPNLSLKEGPVRGTPQKREQVTKSVNELCKSQYKNKVLIKMVLNDDDVVDDFHIDDIIHLAKKYNNGLHDIMVGIKNFKVNYVFENKTLNIIGIRYVHGNKFLICNSTQSINACPHSIHENLDDDTLVKHYCRHGTVKIYKTIKPKSSFVYMRYGEDDHVSTYSKHCLIKEHYEDIL